MLLEQIQEQDYEDLKRENESLKKLVIKLTRENTQLYMKYKQPVERKLDQLENMLIGFEAQFSNPKFTVLVAKEMLSKLKDKVEEIRTLINSEQ